MNVRTLLAVALLLGSCGSPPPRTSWPGPPNDRLISVVRQTCAIADGNQLWCWGQYGPRDPGVRRIVVDGRSTWRDVAYIPPIRGTQTPLCALGTDGTLWRGAIGTMVQVPHDERLQRVTGVGYNGCCAVTDEGHPWCSPEMELTFDGLRERAGEGNLVELGGSHERLCVLTETRNLFCATNTDWEDAANRELQWLRIADGVIDFTLWPRTTGGPGRLLVLDETHRILAWDPESERLTPVVEGNDWGDLGRSCVIKVDGSLWCDPTFIDEDNQPRWGEVTQLGDSEEDVSEVLGSDDEEWRHVVEGQSHVCGMTDNGRIFCAGDNRYGQLGQPVDEDEPREHRYTPVEVELVEPPEPPN